MAENDLEYLFDKATEFVRASISSISADKLLTFYGMYKQATVGPVKSAKPKFWNVEARKKWEAWSAQGNKSKEHSMSDYIAAVEEIDSDWLEHSASSGCWVHHSTMQNNERDVVESERDVFYWAKENDVAKLRKALEAGVDVNRLDPEGLGLCHWAADRGHLPIMRLLLSSGANANLRDEDGQTALHYAASCGHTEMVRLLIDLGASVDLKDADGNTPCHVADSPEVLKILNDYS